MLQGMVSAAEGRVWKEKKDKSQALVLFLDLPRAGCANLRSYLLGPWREGEEERKENGGLS